jgi:multidrug efflux pump subunit AcrB
MAEVHDVAKRIRDMIYVVDGVKRVDLYGVQRETIWIEFSTARLAQLGFSAEAIGHALVSQNLVLPGGSIDTGRREVIVIPRADLRTVEDISNVVINLPDSGQVIRLRDVATVRRAYEDPPGSSFYHNGRQAVLIGVSMADGQNVLDVGPRIAAHLEMIEQLLPIGLEIEIGNYQPTHVDRAVDGVRSNLFQTIGIVLVVIVAFLGVRTGAIVGLHVPLTMVVTIVVMYMMDIALHRISLATLIISLGLLVDNGIVVAEEIGKRLFEGEDHLGAAENAGKTLSTPLLTSSITTVLMFVPLALAPHAAGEYLRSMSQVIFVSLFVSWLLAMTMTPILCSRFLKKPSVTQEEIDAQYETSSYRLYRRMLEALLRRRVVFLASMVGVLAFGSWVFGLLPVQFMPESDRPQILVDVKLPAGYGIRETERRIRELVDWLEDERANPEIEQTLTYVGSGGVRFFVTLAPEPSAANMGFVLVTVDSLDAVEPVMRRIRAHALTEHPSIDLMIKRMFMGATETGLVEARVSTLGLPGQHDELYAAGEEVAAVFADIAGTANIYNDFENRIVKARVQVDQARAQRARVSNEEIANSLRAVLDGYVATTLREGDEEIPISGRALLEERLDADRLYSANVFSSETAAAVPLVQIANIEPSNSFAVIKRRDYATTLTIRAKSLETTAIALQELAKARIDEIVDALGPGFSWEWGGETETRGKANKALFAFVPVCLFGVLVCLVWQFNSFRKPIVVLLTVPVGFTGVAIGLAVCGGYYSFMALLGMLSLIGIVVNNAIVMLEQIEIERRAGVEHFQAIITACQARLKPILMTTLTTILGMVPLIVSRDPLFYDLAIAIAFGLGFATILTLGLAPVLYSTFMRVDPPPRTA